MRRGAQMCFLATDHWVVWRWRKTVARQSHVIAGVPSTSSGVLAEWVCSVEYSWTSGQGFGSTHNPDPCRSRWESLEEVHGLPLQGVCLNSGNWFSVVQAGWKYVSWTRSQLWGSPTKYFQGINKNGSCFCIIYMTEILTVAFISVVRHTLKPLYTTIWIHIKPTQWLTAANRWTCQCLPFPTISGANSAITEC